MSGHKPASSTPYFASEDADQVRAAFPGTGSPEGYTSMSELIEAAISEKCADCSANTTRSGHGNP